MRRFWFHRDEEVRPSEIIRVIRQEPKDTAFEKPKPGMANLHGRGLPKGIIWGVLGLVILFIAGSVVSFYTVKGQVAASVAKDAGVFQSGVNDLQNFDPQSAAQKFASLENASSSEFGSLAGAFGFLFAGSRSAVSSFTGIANELSAFSGELADISASAPQFFATGNGSAFLADLTKLRDTMGTLGNDGGELANLASVAQKASPDAPAIDASAYLPMIAKLQGAKTFLDAFIPWFGSPAPHHVLVLFQNPSEIRPGGGFLGSYADVTIASGSIAGVDIHDIADVDAAFTANIIPPKPLQFSLTRWRPADANWFFDFPTSASETAAFFEGSDLYKPAASSTGTGFDAVIAVSPKVVSDLLTITGPVTADSATFTAGNFLVQTQKIVQAGQATSATYPKQVLRDLATAMFAKLSAAGTASNTAIDAGTLLPTMLDWLAKKDVMVYFKDPTMENFAASYGATGDVYNLPQRFNGDYFALVDANVGGGKQDTSISSTVSYVGQIGADGTFTAHVAVARTHHGNTSPYWWYKQTDDDYMQMFVPDGSAIANASGGVLEKITPRVNYAKNGYLTDPLVAALASTTQSLFAYPGVEWHEESGKTVFATWSILKAGKTAQVALDYTHRLFIPPADGVAYQFVFEKQAGTVRHYDIEIDAPLGYIFAENGLAAFIYHTDDLPGRIIFSLTMKKL